MACVIYAAMYGIVDCALLSVAGQLFPCFRRYFSTIDTDAAYYRL